eukprot:300866-Hanusia_phi.AAC.2
MSESKVEDTTAEEAETSISHRVLGIGYPFSFALVPHSPVDAVDLVGCKQVGDLAGRQQLVHVDQELLVCDLTICEQEHDRLVRHGVSPAQHDLGDRAVADEGRESGQALLAASSDAHQERVSVLNDAADAADVPHGVVEEN